jgi:hypothetical protein
MIPRASEVINQVRRGQSVKKAGNGVKLSPFLDPMTQMLKASTSTFPSKKAIQKTIL